MDILPANTSSIKLSGFFTTSRTSLFIFPIAPFNTLLILSLCSGSKESTKSLPPCCNVATNFSACLPGPNLSSLLTSVFNFLSSISSLGTAALPAFLGLNNSDTNPLNDGSAFLRTISVSCCSVGNCLYSGFPVYSFFLA